MGVAETTIRNLSARFPGKVQIHLHPASSLPSTLIDSFPSFSSPSLSSASALTSTSTSTLGVGAEGSSSSGGSNDLLLPIALVWTVESLKLLRGYGLTGSFTGTLAQFPQQNIFLGLPIQLLPEEVAYLLRKGKAVVVDESSSYRPASKLEVETVQQGIEEDRTSQQLEAWKERQLLRAKHSSSAASSSSKKQQQTPTSTTSGSAPEETHAAAAAGSPKPEELSILPWHYTIASTSHNLSWYEPQTYTQLSSIQRVFAYPRTEREVTNLGLFEYFVSTRYSMWCMNGLRFGGSWAVYPGDPLRYHSHFTAQLVGVGEELSMTSLISNGRLGTAVKKTHLLCAVDRLDPLIRCDFRSRFAQMGEGQAEVAGAGAGEGGVGRGTARRGGGLESVRQGLFDVAPIGVGAIDQLAKHAHAESNAHHQPQPQPPMVEQGEAQTQGRSFAEYTVFSLAWAGFGT